MLSQKEGGAMRCADCKIAKIVLVQREFLVRKTGKGRGQEEKEQEQRVQSRRTGRFIA